jgi:Arc/MetJ-type ribon-helix-helix transcriptional regulator
MATEGEKLCMAIINNSQVTSIDWKGVAAELGMDRIPSVQQRWSRFKIAKFGASRRATKTAGAPKSGKSPTKENESAGKKRTWQEMSEVVEEAVRRLPARKAKEKRIKLETPENDDGEDDKWAEEEKNGKEKDISWEIDDNNADDFADSSYEEA